MIADPVLLLLDEPTSGVDIKTRDEVLHLLADLNAQGMTDRADDPRAQLGRGAPALGRVRQPARSSPRAIPTSVFTAEILNATYAADLRIVRQDGIGPGRGCRAAPDARRAATPPRRLRARPPRARRRGPRPRATIVHADARRGPRPPAIDGACLHASRSPTSSSARASLASVLVGLLCGLIGVYVVLRHMSYIGHGLSHAVFGGAVVAYVAGASTSTGRRACGASLSALLINAVARRRRIGADAAIGIVTTASFAVGVALISKTRSFTQQLRGRAVRQHPRRHADGPRRRSAGVTVGGRASSSRSSTSACCS